MTIINGKVILICPKTGKEVTLHKDCTNADGKGNNCLFFKHFGFQGGFKIYVTCKYGEE